VIAVADQATDAMDLPTMKDVPAEEQLAVFIARFTPEIAAEAHEILAKMRSLLPGAIELVYDNYNALAIGWGPSERASEAICSIALFPRWVSLFFLQGAHLPDPQKLLKGKGNQARHIVLKGAESLDDPSIRALLKSALKRAAKPLDPKQPYRLVIKSISAKQRPRRPS
jgi:hypothetical protein